MPGGQRKGLVGGRRFLWGGAVAAVVFAADQLTKYLITRNLFPGQLVVVVPHFLNITRSHNAGGPFSLFPDKPYVFAAFSLVAITFLAYLFVKVEGRTGATVAAAAVMGGALGNLADRLRLGYVVDFVDMHWGPWHWYVYNVADAAITVGALALFVFTLWDERPRPRRKGRPGVETPSA